MISRGSAEHDTGFRSELNTVLHWSSTEARAWAERALPQLCADANVLAVVLLGSAIRDVSSSFDLDCIFIHLAERPEVPRAPMDVDVRFYPADQVDRLIRNGHDLLAWSIKFGRLLCERDAYWTRLGQRWASALPLPSAEVADARAAQAQRLHDELAEIGDEDAATEQWVTAVTHRARAALLRQNIFPASRPELPDQLHEIGETRLADELAAALSKRRALAEQNHERSDRSAGDIT